jgi:hypothetical protein
VRDGRGLAGKITLVLLRAALFGAILAALWGAYRRLPDGGAEGFGAAERPAATALRVRLRRELIDFPLAGRKVVVQVYPVNLAAARSEFDSERRPGQRFEDFVVRQMGGRQPVSAELDERGEAVVAVTPGRWWVHASVGDTRELTWRLAVNVSGREKTVELTPENAYTRAQKF